jgi:hypothetical protein
MSARDGPPRRARPIETLPVWAVASQFGPGPRQLFTRTMDNDNEGDGNAMANSLLAAAAAKKNNDRDDGDDINVVKARFLSSSRADGRPTSQLGQPSPMGAGTGRRFELGPRGNNGFLAISLPVARPAR